MLHDEMERIRTAHGLPALGATALAEGRPTEVVVAGVRRLGSDEAARADDAFHLGSDTKAMTAALVGLAMDQGRLDASTPLADLLPASATARMHAGWRPATIEHLLTHRAGLGERLPPLGKSLLALHAMGGPLPEQRLAWLTERLQEAPESAPGEKYAYSNAGYVLLGAVTERLAATPWETLVREALWTPLGIRAGGFGAPPALWQHADQRGTLVPIPPARQVDNPPLMGPAGRAYLPLKEWAKFVGLYVGEKAAPLSPPTRTYLTTPRAGGNYQGGWLRIEEPWADGPALTHAGSNTLNYCVATVAPRRRFAALAAANAGGDRARQAVEATIRLLIRAFLN